MYQPVEILIIFSSFLIYVQCKTPALRTYVAKKDMISGPKASQYSFYAGSTEKNITHRIESDFSVMQQISVITYPAMKTVAQLSAQQLGTWYEARIEIEALRNGTKLWYTGLIKKHFTVVGKEYAISLAERQLMMKKGTLSSKLRIFDEKKRLLCMFKKRRFVFSSQVIYDIHIYSNLFPDPLYFLCLAAYDR